MYETVIFLFLADDKEKKPRFADVFLVKRKPRRESDSESGSESDGSSSGSDSDAEDGKPLSSAMVRVNSLWPSDAVWRQGSTSTLVQVMACCLTAPSHYLNQC